MGGGGGEGQGSPFPLLCYTIEEAVDRDWPQETSGPVTDCRAGGCKVGVGSWGG